MRLRYCYLIALTPTVIFSCTDKLLPPLKGGTNFSNKFQKEHGTFSRGTTIYLEPNKSLAVRAVEDCQILAIQSDSNSFKIILAKGKNDVAYGNLSKCFVSKGEMIKRGRTIGELFPKDSVGDNSLSISVEKDGQHVVPNW